MEIIIGNRIKSARLSAGLSQKALAEQLGKPFNVATIVKYEKGEAMPDSRFLLLLARALGVKTDYFIRSESVDIQNIEFRKKSKLSQKEIVGIKNKITDHIAQYVELEQLLNIQTTFENPIQDRLIRCGEDVELAAVHLLNTWKLGLNALPNIIELLESNEVKVVEIAANASFDGLSGWGNACIPIVVLNKNFAVERKRFTALHELAHLLLRFEEGTSAKEVEKYCHRFAGAVLLPKVTIWKELGRHRESITINELIHIKEAYGISIQAIVARAKDVGIISENTYISFRKWIAVDVSRRREEGLGSYKGNEAATRFEQLLYRAAAEEVISMSKAASLKNVKLAAFQDEFIRIW